MAGETILIIDDNADVRTLLGERVLPGYGYRTMTAPDGQEGLWQIRTHKPDLILLDLRLPDMTGLDLLHILSSEGYDTPIILITAYGSELIAAQALRLGVQDYIIKPFTLDEIVESVERALTEQRLRKERNALTVRLQYCSTALRLLADAATTWTAPEDLPVRLRRVLELAVAATQATAGRIWLAEPAGELCLQAVQERPDERAYSTHPQERAPDAVAQALSSVELQQWPLEGSGEEQMALAVPIVLAGRPAGVLEIHLPAADDSLSESSFLVGRTFADLIGAVLESSQLRRQVAFLERQREALGRHCQDLMLVLDENDTIVGVSPAIAKMTGQTPEQAIGQGLRDWARAIESPPGEFPEWYARQIDREAATERYAFSFQGPRGEARQAEVQCLVEDERDGPPRRYLLFREVTAQNRLEQQVRSLRQALAEQERGSRLGLFLTDLKGTILAVNNLPAGLPELRPGTVLGQPLWEALAAVEGAQLLPEEIARACREGTSYTQVRGPDRTAHPLGLASLLLLGPEGAPYAVAVLLGPALGSAARLGPGRAEDEGDFLGSAGLDPGSRS